MDATSIAGFQNSPYHKTADVRMLYFFLHPSTVTLVVLAVLAIFSMIIPQFWCRYLCPYGALTGLAGAMGPTRIQRNENACTGCGKCRKACPKQLPVDQKKKLVTPECIGCMQCVSACPVKGALALRTVGCKRAWSAKKMGFALVAAWLVVICGAMGTGHWKSAGSGKTFQPGLTHLSRVSSLQTDAHVRKPGDFEQPFAEAGARIFFSTGNSG